MVSADGTVDEYTRSEILVDLVGRSSLLQGDLSILIISKDDQAAAVRWDRRCTW